MVSGFTTMKKRKRIENTSKAARFQGIQILYKKIAD